MPRIPRKIQIALLWIAGVMAFYVGSFYLVLLGQRTEDIRFFRKLGLSYNVNYEQGPWGLDFFDAPAMILYRPLSRPIYRRSSDPDAEVELNFYGKTVMAAFNFGWSGDSPRDAWQNAEKYSPTGFTYGEWFPERYPERKVSNSGGDSGEKTEKASQELSGES